MSKKKGTVQPVRHALDHTLLLLTNRGILLKGAPFMKTLPLSPSYQHYTLHMYAVQERGLWKLNWPQNQNTGWFSRALSVSSNPRTKPLLFNKPHSFLTGANKELISGSFSLHKTLFPALALMIWLTRWKTIKVKLFPESTVFFTQWWAIKV